MIVVVGSYNTDIVLKVDNFPDEGETVFVRDVIIGHGGKGSNQAVSASRLGSQVDLIAAVGKDERGKHAIEFWKIEKVGIDKIKVKNNITGSAYILVDKEGNSRIIVHRGANFDLQEEDISELDGDVMLTQMEIRENVVRKALRDFPGLKILNPAPAVIEDQSILNLVDIITPNEVEFKQLTNADDIDYGINILLKRVKKAVIITLGERGSLIATKEKRVIIPAPRVKAIDTTGAGDVFNAALAYMLEKGENLEYAVNFANIVAAISVTKFGAVGPRREEVEKFVKEREE
ncbi:ribokinase [Acidianus sp. RZ1]|uniref:ribokinase n=1 Tax=Acidianus sp. RZ1 TaxID=1540082 RepID=UPI001491920D|nr:ribokinase [Acidianus sp. RZ1]NON63224.1 ribokinase [Acidianus sp. RZ1]